jgi:adenylate cyclase
MNAKVGESISQMQRKLTVIFSADVVGYSALMERDESGTLQRLKDNRRTLFDPRVAAQGGRIFKLMGDGVLIEFPSAASAVACALDIQEAMDAAEGARPESERLRYRIGINLGDVIVEDDDIYGDGVNIAARLQALAPVGGVALSRNVRDQVAGKVAAEFDDLGPHTVKNIETPVHVFAVRAPKPDSAAAPGAERVQKFSICVLPFANMSGDAEQEYFSDGISEDIITDLSKVSALSVIARNSAFAFKGKHVDIPAVARQLNVTHVLEGSVRKSGGRVRITAQLIDGVKNDHVWAERYDRDLQDIFALQDEISQAIVTALKLKLLPEEKKAIEMRGTSSAEAYNLVLMARQEYATGFSSDHRRANMVIRICERAIAIDPNYARAWAILAIAQNTKGNLTRDDGDGGLAAAERALALDPDIAEALAVKALIWAQTDKQEESRATIETALERDPESHVVQRAAGRVYFVLQDLEASARHFAKAVSLEESDFACAGMLVTCYTALGDHEAARQAAQIALARTEKILAADRNNGDALGHGSDALAVLGQSERAKEWMNRALLIEPDNANMRYNFACCLAVHLGDKEGALEMVAPVIARSSRANLKYARIDPDLASLHGDPRFEKMITDAEAALAAIGE